MFLETSRLILRDWAENDADDLAEGLNDIAISKWLAMVPFPYTIENAHGFIDYCIENAGSGNKSSYNFAIELKTEKKVIGGTSIERINKIQETSGGGGIWINSKFHGYGYGTEAFGKRLEFAFNELGLRRLDNGFFEGNLSSKKMQERFGYVVEGKRRKGYKCMADGLYKDEYITGLLKEDWQNRR